MLDKEFSMDSFFFFFSALNISALAFLACKISKDKLPDTLIEELLYLTSSFFLAAFKVVLVFNSLIVMCLDVGLFVFLLLEVC